MVKTVVFWVAAPCSLVEIDRRFISTYCLHHQGDVDRNGTMLLPNQKSSYFLVSFSGYDLLRSRNKRIRSPVRCTYVRERPIRLLWPLKCFCVQFNILFSISSLL
jgi:hypothetical protein